ncbi:SAM-dependent methyltransferase [Streptomyces flavofungini]|uniref:SAM-dependent methyltransferase n=1 Tax=Streptomyces flavofungini TaxID=68200 RepID=UPI0025AFE2BD|nr:SAM-dependent methyltransferase [Streptomyces flavofungini]WJV50799.1 SAM-dependent methyltransferase [Streptomyces flavofungini]
MTESAFHAGDIDTSVPHPARMYDWFLGGKDNYPADWAAAEEVVRLMPGARETAWANREFMHRAVRFVAGQGVRQFLDVGTGIPTEPNLHQIAQDVAPDARVVYTDNDPIVLRHAEALLRGRPEGRTAYVQADLRDPESIIEYARAHLDFTRPIALSLIALLHYVTDEQDPQGIVDTLLEPLAPGSHLLLSHVTHEFAPGIWERIDEIYRSGGTPVRARSHAEVRAFFAGLEVCDPGVVVGPKWRPDAAMRIGDEGKSVYVGVGRKV